MKLSYKVSNKSEYTNIKEVLKLEFSMSDRLLLKLKKLQKITLNGNLVYVHHPIHVGDLIECDLDYVEDNSNIFPSPISFHILYEDASYLIINKPAGIPVHPSCEHYTDSLSNGIRFYFDKIGLHKKIRPVNRLDKDTSGLVIFAKNEYIQECLVKQMKSKNFVKKYIAIVEGHLEEKAGTICAPIARKENSIIERCVNENGDFAVTHYKVLNSEQFFNIFDDIQTIREQLKINSNLELKLNSNLILDSGSNLDCNFINSKELKKDVNQPNFEIVECTLETGRTHQIRVHFSHLGHSLLGDTLYGSFSPYISRQALHCYFMSFIHPITKEAVSYKASLPQDMCFSLLLFNF